MKKNINPNQTSPIPLAALPPEEHWVGPMLDAMFKYVIGRFRLIDPDIPDMILETICRIIQMLVPLDDITGLALSEDETTLEPNSKKVPLTCHLAEYFIDSQDKELPRQVRDLGLILRAEETLLRFPELGQRPRPGKNPLWMTHADLFSCSVYPLFARDLQLGLVAAWKAYGWRQEKTKSLSSLVTSVRRILPLLQADEIRSRLDMSDELGIADLVHLTADNLTYIGRIEWLPEDTREQYYRDFCTAINREFWLEYPRRESGGGGYGAHHRPPSYDPEDDLPEGDNAPDGYLASEFEKYARSLDRDMDEGKFLLEGIEDMDESLPQGRYIYSEEHAVMREYLSPTSWDCTHPQELAWLVEQLINRVKNGSPVILALSIIYLGRSSTWLKSVVLGETPDQTELMDSPIYLPELDMVLYPPDLVKSYPTRPQMTEDLFIPVTRNWSLPLPEALILFWKTLAADKQPGDFIFSDASLEAAKALLKELTLLFQRDHPNAPRFSEGRLRKAYTVLITHAGLNEVYGAMISGQWRLPLRVPLFYTTLSYQQLAKRFRLASRNMDERLRSLNLAIPEAVLMELAMLPGLSQGSPYSPRKKILQQTIDSLVVYLQSQKATSQTWHNALTLAAFWGLDLFCGLRFQELCKAKVVQFDLLATWQGQPMPWLQLPDAKSNRFTTAARLVPISGQVLPLVTPVLNPSRDKYALAFWYWDGNTRREINRTVLDQWREDAKIPLLRWHSSRQALNSGLFLFTQTMDTANVILGHQAAGRELFNRYLPGNPQDYWKDYLDYCDLFAAEMGWQGVLDVINNENPYDY